MARWAPCPFAANRPNSREVWDRFQAGDEKGANEVFYRRILPVNRLTGLGPAACYYHIHKEILRQRGVIRTNLVRGPIAPLNELIWREVQMVIDDLYPR